MCFAPSSPKEDAAETDTPPTVQESQPIAAKESDDVTTSGKPAPPPVEEHPVEALTPTPALPKLGIGAVSELSSLLPSTPETKQPNVKAVVELSAEPQKEQPADSVGAELPATSANQKAASEAEGPLWAALEESVAADSGGEGRTRDGVEDGDKQEDGGKEKSSAVAGG